MKEGKKKIFEQSEILTYIIQTLPCICPQEIYTLRCEK
jgi:hypothetical protein